MIPLRDYNPTYRFPIVTTVLIILNLLAFGLELLLDMAGALGPFIQTFGFVPYRLVYRFDLFEAFTVFSSMFLHGSPVHLLGNMLYLWIFGNNIEDRLGRTRFILFYLLCGIIATLSQVLADTTSMIPGIGASGAIAGVLGAYLILFPTVRVATLIPLGIFLRVVQLPAVIVLGFWFIIQFFNGVLSFGMSQTGGVAWFAHIGGFLGGLLLIGPFMLGRRRGPPPARWMR